MKISLIEFSVENYKIFKEKVTFSMISRKSHHTFESNGENLLKSTMIYGPNASGKTTLLQALRMCKTAILHSAGRADGDYLRASHFRLSENEEKNPTLFELTFSLESSIYKYSYSFLPKEVVSEKLVEILANGTEKEFFSRENQKISLFASFKRKKDLIEKTRKDALFLSVASQWNDEIAMSISEGLRNIRVVSGVENDSIQDFTKEIFKKDLTARDNILSYMRWADFCITGGEVEQTALPDEVKEAIKKLDLKNYPSYLDSMVFHHNKFDSRGNTIGYEKFQMVEESIGTQNFFTIIGPVIDALENGRVLLIDEFDNSLHPVLTKYIVDLFERKNPHNAQLIVTTHDTSLLSYKDDFDRVQFWFTEKDKFGVGKLFSLAEFALRNNTEYSKKYLEGRFGALPFVEPF